MKKYLIYASFALALCCVLAAGAKATPTGLTSISLCAFPTGCVSGGDYFPRLFIAGSSSTIYFSGTPGPTGESANLAIAIPYADNSANWASGDLFDSLNLMAPYEYYFYPPGYHPFDFSVAQSKSSMVLGYAPGSYATVSLIYNWGTNPTALTPQAIKLESLPVGSLILGFTTRGSAFYSPISVTPWGASLLVTPAPTPEPASILLFGSGLLGMALMLRKSLLA